MAFSKAGSGISLAVLLAASPVAADVDAGQYYCTLRDQSAEQTPWQTVQRFIPDEDTAANTVSARVCHDLMQILTDGLSSDLNEIYQYLFRPKTRLAQTRPSILAHFNQGFVTREWSESLILHDALDDMSNKTLQRFVDGQFDHDELAGIVRSCWSIGRAALNQPAPEDLSPYSGPDVFFNQFKDLEPAGVPTSEALAPTIDALVAQVDAGSIELPADLNPIRAELGETCEGYTGRLPTPYTDFTKDLDCTRLNDVVTALSFHYPAYLSNVAQDARTRARYEKEYGFGQDKMRKPVQSQATCSISSGKAGDRFDRHSLTCSSFLPMLAQTPQDREAEAIGAVNSFRMCFALLNGNRNSVMWVDDLEEKIGRTLNIGESIDYQHFTTDGGASALRGSLLWNEEKAITKARRLRTNFVFYDSVPFMRLYWSIDTFSNASAR